VKKPLGIIREARNEYRQILAWYERHIAEPLAATAKLLAAMAKALATMARALAAIAELLAAIARPKAIAA